MVAGNNRIGYLYTTIPDVYSSALGNLSLTSQYKVSLMMGNQSSGNDVITHLKKCELLKNAERYDFMCAEAVLPGSTFDTGEEFGSRQGVSERFPNRRVFSDFNLTFYVDKEYDLVRLFEEWMNFIDPIYDENGAYNGDPRSYAGGYLGRNDYFRFKYPNSYKRNIAITKFERDFLNKPNDRGGGGTTNQTTLTYYFVDAFPTNLTALPLSYEGSTITKTTINFSYTRYTVNKHKGSYLPSIQNQQNNSNPDQPNNQSKEYYGPAFESNVSAYKDAFTDYSDY